MRRVTGSVVSTDSISLPKAASIIHKFASVENGATQAVNAYIRRTSAALNELSHLHEDLDLHGKLENDVFDDFKEQILIAKSSEDAGNGRLGEKQRKRERENIDNMVTDEAKLLAKQKKGKVEEAEEGAKIGSEERRSKKKKRKLERGF